MTKSFMIRHADHVGFAVASLDEAIAVWTEGLGARLVRTGEMGGTFIGEVTGARGAGVRVAIVELAGQTIELLEYRGAGSTAVGARPFDLGVAHLAFIVDDIETVLGAVAPYGWHAQGLPQTIESGARAGTRVTYLISPDGATIELMQPPS